MTTMVDLATYVQLQRRLDELEGERGHRQLKRTLG